MRFITMRSAAGEAPAIIATPEPGESPAEGGTVEGGSGRISAVSPGSVAIRAVEMFTARPDDLPEDAPFTPESLGYVLARRIRDGLLTLTIDGGS